MKALNKLICLIMIGIGMIISFIAFCFILGFMIIDHGAWRFVNWAKR
jgi:hypothetical protein